MSESKKTVLERVRKALQSVPDSEGPEDVSVPREYRRKGGRSGKEITDLFATRVGEYKAEVMRISRDAVKDTATEVCRDKGIGRIIVPHGYPQEWLPDGVELLEDRGDNRLSHEELDRSDGVVTTCALAVAQTGTIILDAAEGQGRRALTLVPDFHLCIVREDQIVELFPEAVARLESTVREQAPPITLISGPSATSDIELSRVEGVHGPRRLTVLILSE